ncbi:hypothetical protein BCV69DRAFT_285072 [Microstroma glucosiphilum]|uniref:Rrp15p-domain-containing protein n=1 Tax=Pseudomicrostroma glucosiphilum TaxID=1684307 RepID=A0A316U1Y5_9BASI|nr:hypothetical protein BCV69DRAFT_285072 [Pseudomicrostroma glucosiphilum]PWN18443.1 hypothetical protein BCV69DRAFT_285072 [Pseudomicrostroma glucosiphilum]
MPPHRTRPSPSGLASHGKSKGKFSTKPPALTARGATSRSAAGSTSTGGKPAKSMTSPTSASRGGRPAAFPTKLSAAAGKRRRAAEEEEEEEEEEEDETLGSAAEDGEDEDGEVGTDEEIENAMERGRSSKTAKRKRRAVSPTSFGQTLSAFLGDESDEGASSSLPSSAVPSTSQKTTSKTPTTQASVQGQSQPQAPIFSLAPSISSRISSTKLSEKAARVALEERRSREDQFRVRDLIGGWGRPGEKPGQSSALTARGGQEAEESDAEDGEKMNEWLREGGSKGFERRLRKVAQRGVVKLFNAIRAAQSTTTDDVEERNKGLTAAAASSASAGGATAVVRPGSKNALGGKSKELADLSKANFLDLIRSGGGSGKTVKA